MPATEPDYYLLLKVDPSAGVEQIKAAYLRQIVQWHPDRNRSEEATRRTAQINAAWEILQDPVKRAAFDRRRRRRHATPPPNRPRSRPRPDPVQRSPRPASDPAAAERARQAAEASAREAEARRRRDAQYEQRRKASEHLWVPPPEGAYGWADRDFVAGRWYRNSTGPYRVIDLRGKFVDIYYPDGAVVSFPRDDLWQNWQRQVQRRNGRNRPAQGLPRRMSR